MGGLLLAIFFLALGVVALIAFSGTPQTTGASTCGPITFFNWQFSVHADCKVISIPELVTGIGLFLLALLAALTARPGRR